MHFPIGQYVKLAFWKDAKSFSLLIFYALKNVVINRDNHSIEDGSFRVFVFLTDDTNAIFYIQECTEVAY